MEQYITPTTEPKEQDTTPTTEPKEQDTTPTTEPKEQDTTPTTEPKEQDTTPTTEPKEQDTTPTTEPKEQDTTPTTEPKEQDTTPTTEPKEQEELLIKDRHIDLLEEKLQRSIVDFQNLEKQIKLNVENQINYKIDKFMMDFLEIYDDLVRAKNILDSEEVNTSGIRSILKNITSLLTKYKVSPIEALGELFDPNFHESIKIIEDDTLDENTITKEIRKGYISHNRVIRPSIVVISRKLKGD